MKMSKRVIPVILSVIMLLALAAACGSTNNPASSPAATNPAAPTPAAPGPVVPEPPPDDARFAEHIDIIVDSNNIAVINPYSPAGNTGPTQWTLTLIHDRLVENLGDGVYGQMLATSWDTDDWQTYRFNLRDDVYFHNGERFTAEDIRFTVSAAQDNPGTIGFDRWRFVESVTVLDSHTVEIVLQRVHIDFLFDISTPPAGIVNERAFREDPDTWTWIGTGPYQVIEFATNDYVTVQRFDDYWGETPITSSLTLRFVPEPSARLVMLQNRESDVCFSITPEDLAILEADPNFRVFPVIFNAPNVLGFNMADPLMSDRNFRMAAMHALNSEEIAMVAAGNWADPVLDGNVWGYATEFRHNNIERLPFDLDLARQYLDASPYNGEEIEIAAAIQTNILAAEIIQQQLAQAGIVTRINSMDTPAFISYIAFANNQSQLHVFASSFTLSAIGSTSNIYYPGAGNNRTSHDNPYVTELIDRARGIGDLEERRALFMHLQEYIADDPPHINVFWRLNGVAAINGIDGMRLGYDAVQYNLRGIYRVLED